MRNIMTVHGHLAANRFGYGLRLGEAPPGDPEAWLAAQLGAEDPLPPAPDVAARLLARAEDQAEERAGTIPPGQSVAPRARAIIQADMEGWAARRLRGTQPFRERLVDFWMNHFTVSRRNGLAGLLAGALERDAIRPHVTGRFADMLQAVSLHPAMLAYLDNGNSIGPGSSFGRRSGRGLNENLAREILELHTLSPAGGYGQADVIQLARILTGHAITLQPTPQGAPLGYVFRPGTHEPGAKELLGHEIQAGPEGAATALRLLAHHPATLRHLAVKLARHVSADDPPPELVAAVLAALGPEGDLGAAARVLVSHPQAWTPAPGKFRRPADHVIATARALGLVEEDDRVLRGMALLDQALWNAGQPDGYADRREAWVAPEAMLRRVEWSYAAAGRAGRVDLAAVTEAALGPLARAETVAELRRAGSVRDALTMLFSSPEFLHR